MSSLERILIDHAGCKGMGDVVCEMNFYPAMRRRYPHARLYSRNSRTLAWGRPEIAGFDQSTPDEGFDLVFRPHDLSDLVQRYRDSLAAHRSVFDHFLWHRGLEPLGVPPQLYVLPRELEMLGLEDDGGDELVVAYSIDSKDLDRRWDVERFLRLLQHLEATYPVSFVELGSGLSAGHLGMGLDLVGQTNLRQSMAVLSMADLFIGNHGGLTHLAGGVGTPMLSPWGASTPYAAYAYDDYSVAIETEPSCRHCNWTLERIPRCLTGNYMYDRSPCMDAIAVERLIEGAERLIPRIQAGRGRLRSLRAERRAAARDPLALEIFEQGDEVSPNTRVHLSFGGTAGWAGDHAKDNFARMKLIVAFPDWLRPSGDWRRLLAHYVAGTEASDSTVLLLSAYPFTGPEAKTAIERFVQDELKPGKPLPKILVLLGALDLEERQALIDRAAAYVPLPSDYHVEPGSFPTRTPYLDHLAQMAGR